MTTLFKCDICGRVYEDQLECEVCEAHGYEKTKYKVGDIVLLGAGFRWFDGDKRWITNPDALDPIKKGPCESPGSNCFSPCCSYQFYYVITKIDKDPRDGHRARIHCATKAMSGKQGYRKGYTFTRNHITPEKVKNPPKFIVEDSKDLIGVGSKTLI